MGKWINTNKKVAYITSRIHFIPSFLTSFLFLFSFFRASMSMCGKSAALASSQCCWSPRTHTENFGLGRVFSLGVWSKCSYYKESQVYTKLTHMDQVIIIKDKWPIGGGLDTSPYFIKQNQKEQTTEILWHHPDQLSLNNILPITVTNVQPNSGFNCSAWGHELTSSATQSLPSCFKTQGGGPPALLPPAGAGSAQSDYPKYFSMSAPGLPFCFFSPTFILAAISCHSNDCFQTGLVAHKEKVGSNNRSNLTVPEKRLSFWGS